MIFIHLVFKLQIYLFQIVIHIFQQIFILETLLIMEILKLIIFMLIKLK